MKKILLLSAALSAAVACTEDEDSLAQVTPDDESDDNVEEQQEQDDEDIEILETIEKPNILFIMTDQQSHYMMSNMMGLSDKITTDVFSTPGMDRIAASGYSFTKTYCNNPVSMPSRFSLMTGMPASAVGVKGNSSGYDADLVTYYANRSTGSLLKAAGYDTQYYGKTHLYNNKTDFGFTFGTSDPYQTGCTAAVNYIKGRASKPDDPFFLYVSLMNPHDICYDAGMDPRFVEATLSASNMAETQVYLDYKASLSTEQYQSQVPAPLPNEAWVISDSSDPDMPDPMSYKDLSTDDYVYWTTEEQELFRWMYYRLTESVDNLVGQVLDALDEAGLTEKTIIIFTSDHGEILGAHGYKTKSLPFEECQRVPFMFSGPGIRTNIKDHETLTCNGLDLLPTICDFAGVTPPDYITGVSLKPILTGDVKNQIHHDYLVIESSSTYCATDGSNKLSIYEKLSGLPRVFTNLDEDPYEEINMLKYNRHAAAVTQLQGYIDQYMADNGLTYNAADVDEELDE